ncbi:TPA: hypothetical protein DEP21_02475 [Patescibacteria group bacterium]|nr:hypothetical protein [Candidatus Gracilibacteria bacterium]
METAKGQLEDKIEGFTYGADDYLTKPFDLQELELRIKAVTKRNTLGEVRHRKDLVVDLEKQEIFKKGKRISVTNKEFLIIQMLMDHSGTVVSRTDLLEEVWGEESIWEEDNKLDVYISNIRRKLGKTFIETIKGHGYKISM